MEESSNKKPFKRLFTTFKGFLKVRVIGLEPTRLAAPDPKSGTSTNFAIPAKIVSANIKININNKCSIPNFFLISFFVFLKFTKQNIHGQYKKLRSTK